MTDNNKSNIIVTGASGGIGNSIVEKLYETGANILATGTNVEKLEILKKKFKKINILSFDISKHDKIENFINEASELLDGNLNCLVNNAGITRDNLAIRMSFEEWTDVINVNLSSTFLIVRVLNKKKGILCQI